MRTGQPGLRIVSVDGDEEDQLPTGHGQVLPPEPTPVPAPFFKGSAADTTHAALANKLRPDERAAIFLAQSIHLIETDREKLERQVRQNAIDLDARAEKIVDLRETVATLNGKVELLEQRLTNEKQRLKTEANKSKAALALASFLIPIGIGLLDKERGIGITLILLGAASALVGIFPSVLRGQIKDESQ